MRTGVIAQKLGMTSIYTDLGEQVPVTVLKIDGCQVISVQTEEKNGYVSLQLGAGKAKVKNVSKPVRGHYAKAKIEPKVHVAEFRVGKDAVLEVGAEITADHFVPGQFVDVTGITLGHGFSGAMKRWSFKGLRATHGVSVTHRAHGSTGQRQDPGKVFKGKKMAGHWGAEKATVQNLKVVSVDPELGYVMVQGAVPGHKNCWLTVKDAVKKKLPKDAPFPAKFRAGSRVEAQAESKSEEKKG